MPKNRIPLTESPAYRKANHDAMKAIRASVIKLKAERERFFCEEGKGRDKPKKNKLLLLKGTTIREAEGRRFESIAEGWRNDRVKPNTDAAERLPRGEEKARRWIAGLNCISGKWPV